MIHLVWSGHGYLVAVITFASCLLMELTTRAVFHDNSYYQDHAWPMAVALATAGAICFVVGRLLNGGPTQTLVNLETGERHVLPPSRHTFFFIPVQFWGPLLFVIAVVAAIYGAVNGEL